MILGIPNSFEVEVDVVRRVESVDSSSPTVIRIDSNEFERLNNSCRQDLHYLTSRFQSAIDLQNDKVKKVITMEKERIRQEQEERRRNLEEQEKKRKEQEELANKQREEEQKRAEEQRKLEEEREKARKVKEEIEEKQAKERELKEAAANEFQEKQRKLQEAEANKSADLEKQVLEYQQKIKDININIKEKVNNDKDLKKSVGPIRRAINPKFGQLSSSASQLNSITNAIINSVNDVQNHPLAFAFILNFIAKAIVSQAETEIVVQQNAAVPLARLTFNLLNAIPQLNEYLMPRLVKKCPLVIGYTCPINTEEGRLRMGWKRSKSTQKWEEADKYDERLAGIFSLFAVLTTLDSKDYPISMSWTCLAKIGNLDKSLLQNVHFFCLANWWESCGNFFLRTYKSQAVKLLNVLAFELTNGQRFPAATRLKLLGEEGIGPNIRSLKEMTP